MDELCAKKSPRRARMDKPAPAPLDCRAFTRAWQRGDKRQAKRALGPPLPYHRAQRGTNPPVAHTEKGGAMPTIANPFLGNVERKMTDEELLQALRIDVAGEMEAIFLYDAHVQATENEAARKVLADIRDEERQHIGELITLMRHLDPAETQTFFEGKEEVQEMLQELGLELKE